MKDINKSIIKLMEDRYTCKGYDPEKKVSDEDFQTIMEVARLSPSSMGYEPWKFIRLKNKDIIEELKPICWGAENAFNGASHIILMLARTPKHMKYDSEYLKYIMEDVQKFPKDILEQRRSNAIKFQTTDFDLLGSERAMQDWTMKQIYIPLTAMLLTAAALGIDSTPIEGFHQEKANEILVKNNVYNGEDFRIANMVAFGYTNRDHRPKTRRKMEEVFEEF